MKYFGFYRAKVINAKDPEKQGRVLVWIPDIMPLVSDSRKGLWARPANNPVGGRNLESGEENYYMGSCFIPQNGAWVWIFFETGNINRPYYFAGLDIANTTVLPENKLGTEYEKKWTIFKSHDGRCVVISDDSDDERVEITGKKRQMSTPPSGDTNSVYTIDDNQTTILFDERSGKEKILIRTHKGDFFHIDIDQQKLQAYFKSDIEIKSDGSIYITAKEKMQLKSTDDFNIATGSDFNLSVSGSSKSEANRDINHKSGRSSFTQAVEDIHHLAGGNINNDATLIKDQCGSASSASSAEVAEDATPEGERDT